MDGFHVVLPVVCDAARFTLGATVAQGKALHVIEGEALTSILRDGVHRQVSQSVHNFLDLPRVFLGLGEESVDVATLWLRDVDWFVSH